MIMTTKNKNIQYDTKTGERLKDGVYHYWRCPKYIFLLTEFLDSPHDSFDDVGDSGGY